jgi:peptidoglycan lytic transglycosylase
LAAGAFSVALTVLVAITIRPVAVHSDVRVPELPRATRSMTPGSSLPQFGFAPGLAQDAHQKPGPLHELAALYRGIASWYGGRFNGRPTASGKPFNMYAMTAATTESDAKLPLGTKVRVTDRRSHRSVVVKIDDRGPLPDGRIIDLSYGAAQKLAMIEPGIAYVRLDVLSWGREDGRH